MKKIFLFLMVSILLMGCSNSIDDIEIEKNIRETEVFAYSGGNRLLSKSWNKKEEIGYTIPDEGKYDVWFYIRIDGNIPGESELYHPDGEYFPQTTAGKSMVSYLNYGTVISNVDWRSCEIKNFPKYIYSTDGSAVQSIIVEEPTLESMLTANKGKYDLSGYIEHKDELHFIWYTCKQQKSDHIWHIDGILTSKDRTDISETIYGEKQKKDYEDAGMVSDTGDVVRNAYVEVDVHQQEHKDWNEIKTSIHMRDTVDVEVFLPIGYEEMADDFDIRVGKDFEYITELKTAKIQLGGETYEFEVSIKHEKEGIRILVKPNVEALKVAREMYDDGITFEIHSYVTSGIPTKMIWEKMKLTETNTTPYTKLIGQITSAYYGDKVEINK